MPYTVQAVRVERTEVLEVNKSNKPAYVCFRRHGGENRKEVSVREGAEEDITTYAFWTASSRVSHITKHIGDHKLPEAQAQ